MAFLKILISVISEIQINNSKQYFLLMASFEMPLIKSTDQVSFSPVYY